MLSPRPPAPATSASSPSVSTSSPVSVLLPSITTNSALYESCRSKSKDEFICQVADDFSSNLFRPTDPPVDAIGPLSSGSMSKTVMSGNTSKVSKSGLECVQCVEVFHDTMNHCVPDWDAAGREMDVIWEPTDLFSPGKGKWDSGHARKSDLGFVPEQDFEELCWEDGQLLVVMQGLNSKGNIKNRSCWQANGGETTPLTSGIQTTANDSAFDTLGTAELMDPSTANMHSQEDELLSWLQHPPEDLVDKLAIPSDTVGTPLVNGDITLPNDLTHRNIRRSHAFSQELGSRPVSKNVRSDALATSPMNTLNKLCQDKHGVSNQQTQMNTLAGCSLNPTASMTSKEPRESGSMIARGDTLLPAMHSATVGMPCSSPMRNARSGAMNFSNFSRPAVTFKANLHSLGMVNGPSGAERLKQLERVSVDASKCESIDSTTKHLRLIAPRRGGVGLTALTFSQSVRASNVHYPPQSFALHRGSEQDALAIGAGNRCSGIAVPSDGLNSSLISSTTLGLDGNTEVLEATELSESSSSGGSEESDDIDGKRGAGVGKRKSTNNEDLEIQSKELENEAIGSKKHAMGGGNSIKKSRAAENHNQSERRRRDRISEKMKALQALVPNSYKTDKASMLEEAISYIKALKAQIQMMSFRSGTYFSPVLMPHGMQTVQMAAWPHMGMGMNMGMGMSAGMGMLDMSMAMAAAAPIQFSPMLPFPGAVIPAAAQTATSAALDSARLVHGVAGHVVPIPAPQMVLPARPGVPIVSTCDLSPTLNVASPKIISASQQHQPVQGSNLQLGWMGGNSTSLSYPHQCLQPTGFMTGFGSLQQQ